MSYLTFTSFYSQQVLQTGQCVVVVDRPDELFGRFAGDVLQLGFHDVPADSDGQQSDAGVSGSLGSQGSLLRVFGLPVGDHDPYAHDAVPGLVPGEEFVRYHGDGVRRVGATSGLGDLRNSLLDLGLGAVLVKEELWSRGVSEGEDSDTGQSRVDVEGTDEILNEVELAFEIFTPDAAGGVQG